jgi:hypothetical protein
VLLEALVIYLDLKKIGLSRKFVMMNLFLKFENMLALHYVMVFISNSYSVTFCPLKFAAKKQ